MKRIYFFIVAFMAMLLGFSQSSYAGEPVILDIKHPTQSGTGIPRSPVQYPEAYIDGYTLTFDSSCIGCTITLLNENEEVVYINVVTENGEVEIPTTFVGTYELQLVRGSITFVGEIEL